MLRCDSRPLILIVDERRPTSVGAGRPAERTQLRGVGGRGRRERARAGRLRAARSDPARRADAQVSMAIATCRGSSRTAAHERHPGHFMTGLIDTVSKVKGFELGAVDYITKPFQHDEVWRGSIASRVAPAQTRLQQSEERLSRSRIDHGRHRRARRERPHRHVQPRRRAHVPLLGEAAVGQSCERFLSGSAASNRDGSAASARQLRNVDPRRTSTQYAQTVRCSRSRPACRVREADDQIDLHAVLRDIASATSCACARWARASSTISKKSASAYRNLCTTRWGRT